MRGDALEEPVLYHLPFRGRTLAVWSDTSPGQLAVIAHLSLADPRLDAFYLAAGVTLQDPDGRVVFPDGTQQQDRLEADRGTGALPPERPVAVGESKEGTSPLGRGSGASPDEGDARPGPDQAAEEGDLFALFGI